MELIKYPKREPSVSMDKNIKDYTNTKVDKTVFQKLN